jgi:hypothetical protein
VAAGAATRSPRQRSVSRPTGWSSDTSRRLDTTVNAGDGGMVMDTRYLVGLALHEG